MHSKENVEFARENQSHYCGEKPLTVDEYIARQPEGVRQELLQVRGVLRAALPGAEERISKHHIGLYPGAEAVAHFASELDGAYAYSKGSIRIPYGQADVDLIARIAAWCLSGTEA